MEITLRIDISEKLQAIAERFAEIAVEYVGKMGDCEPVSSCGPVDTKTCEIPLLDADPAGAADSEVPEQNDAPAQSSCDCEDVSDVQPEKPKAKKSRSKKAQAEPEPVDAPQETAEMAPRSAETPEPVADTPEPQNDAQAQASCNPEPESEEDPYCGMTLLGAVQSLLDEVGQKGLELADVNARVRKECSALSLPFNSAACLMKAVGYKEARRIALGE